VLRPWGISKLILGRSTTKLQQEPEYMSADCFSTGLVATT
jgi:hypothetical protein